MGGLQMGANYVFDGPFTRLEDLWQESGVYAISVLQNGLHTVLDIGESDNIFHRISNHDRKSQWQIASKGLLLHVSTYYCNEPNRMAIERELRAQFNPICGLR